MKQGGIRNDMISVHIQRRMSGADEIGAAGEIPDEYIYIGDKCFLNNGKVHGVTLPAGCRVVGKQAFEGCQFQKAVEFPESLVEIKRRGFAGNRRLRKVVFPHNLERIGAQCYRECSNLKVAEFEKNSKCKVISEGIFDSCTKLERVCLPEAVKSIEKRAFYRCKELKEYQLTEFGDRDWGRGFLFLRNRRT